MIDGDGHFIEFLPLVFDFVRVTHGFGCGHAYLWAQDATLLATASQTSVVRMEPHGDAFFATTNSVS